LCGGTKKGPQDHKGWTRGGGAPRSGKKGATGATQIDKFDSIVDPQGKKKDQKKKEKRKVADRKKSRGGCSLCSGHDMHAVVEKGTGRGTKKQPKGG